MQVTHHEKAIQKQSWQAIMAPCEHFGPFSQTLYAYHSV